MKGLAILLCLVVSAVSLCNPVSAVSLHNTEIEEWEAFKVKYDKNYVTEFEDRQRFAIFLENKRKVEKHNEEFAEGKHTYILGSNKFSDMLPNELEVLFRGYKRPQHIVKGLPIHKGSQTQALPDSVDWRAEGAVTPVKNQGQCGGSWAFSATGSLEGQVFIKTGILVSLSDQNLIDCVKNNSGCTGGSVAAAFAYVIENGGIDTAESYPYTGVPQNCAFDPNNIGGHCIGFVSLPSGDEDALQDAVANIGPISVVIDASQMDFQIYTGGVYKNAKCSSTMLNHAVLVVGYGTDVAGNDYWIVKNSWGSSWGMSGYINIARNDGNMCGIASDASYPVVE